MASQKSKEVPALEKFDQIVAISQDSINANLKVRFNTYKSLSKFKVDSDDDDGTGIDSTMRPPTVRLYVPDDPRKARFFLHFDKGTFSYRARPSPEVKKKELFTHSMDNWTLAFMATLSQHRRKANEAPGLIPDKVLAQLDNPGSYSLTQIILDLTTSSVVNFDLDACVTPGLNLLDKEENKARTYLRNFMNDYIDTIAKEGHTIVGSALTKDRDGLMTKSTASLPPVYLKTQTMRANQNEVDNGGNDAFLFCELLAHRPADPESFGPLEGWKQWVKAPASGTMVIAHRSIWNGYFVERLRFFIPEMIDLLGTVNNWLSIPLSEPVQSDKSLPWKIGAECPTANGVTPQWNSISELCSYQWSNEIKSQWTEVIDWGRDIDHTSAAGHGVLIQTQIVPNTNQIGVFVRLATVEGNVSDKDVIFTHVGSAKFRSCLVEFTVNFPLETVEDGALGFGKPVIKVLQKNVHCYEGEMGWFSNDINPQRELADRIVGFIESRLASNDFLDKLSKGIKNQAMFQFSGGRTFMFKDPSFNGDGDLTAALTFRGS
ncbi:hypothetical protein OC845_005733 [Tilletia horrida]|nr:hypothetical protein OC845_005733 [Tilletia horrida]